ncbi:MAG: GNAT family N-acetyltransferase [Betaproteobacteria bacterium]
MTAPHPLDNVFWNALRTRQAGLARGGDLARRFDPAYALFASMPVFTAECWQALAQVMAAGETVAVTAPHDVAPGPLFEVLDVKDILQMIGPATGAVRDPDRFVVLGAADAPHMAALAGRTKPGPWFERTGALGRFVGFEAEGRLVAMAGERLRVPSHTEISAVCTDAEWRGRGLAADLMRIVSQAIVARGELPFLHVLASNAQAIALYEKLGFTRRLAARFTVLRRV